MCIEKRQQFRQCEIANGKKAMNLIEWKGTMKIYNKKNENIDSTPVPENARLIAQKNHFSSLNHSIFKA